MFSKACSGVHRESPREVKPETSMKDNPEEFSSPRLANGIPTCSDTFLPKSSGSAFTAKRKKPPWASLSRCVENVWVQPRLVCCDRVLSRLGQQSAPPRSPNGPGRKLRMSPKLYPIKI